MSRFSPEGRAGVQHPPKRSKLIGQSWGAPFRLSVDFGPWDTTEIGCGPGTSASDMNLVVSIKGSTTLVVGILTLIPIHGAPPRLGSFHTCHR